MLVAMTVMRHAARCLAPLLASAIAMLSPAQAAAFSVQDDDRLTLQLTGPARRIVSLSPGATAMLFAAGAGERVVGTSVYSDEPEAAKSIERIGDSHSFDLERVLALHPDVVVVWSGGTSLTQVARLQRVGLPIYHHHLTRLNDIPDSLRRLGALAATEARAQAVAADLAQRIAALRERYQTGTSSVLIQIWDRPIYTVGRNEIVSDIIEACGYRNAYQDLADAAPAITIESVLSRNPDIILALTPDQNAANDWIGQWQAFKSLKAVRTGRVLAWSDPRLTGFGPGTVAAAEALCRRLRSDTARP
jgi:iron complex transport system substrate-binding protein